MADGMEDLQEKNRERESPVPDRRYDGWRTFQGREDAEMLQEKTARWSSRKDARGDYDAWEADE